MAKDIIITPADGDIVFDNSSGAECGAITQDGNNLVISNAVGDVLIGDGASDIYIGDGTNNVDILFEQTGNIKAEDGSTGVTLTIGSSDTTPALGSPISSDLTVGVNDTGHDVKFFGATAGSYMLWDQSEDGLQIIHPTGDAGLEVYTVSQGAPNSPQFKVGRASTEYWGVYTEDRTAHLIHRQDETDGDAMNTSFELWGGGSGNDNWVWKHGTNTGGSLATVMTLDKAGLLTVTGTIGSGAITSTGKITGTELEGTSLDINGRADFQAISTSTTGTVVRGGFLNPAAEASMVHIPHIINDLAGFNKWSNSSITVTGLYKTRSGSSGNYTYSNPVAESDFDSGKAFDAHSSTAGSWYSDNGADGSTAGVGVITLEWTNELQYSSWVGIVFGAVSFTPQRVKIEAYQTDDGWQTLCDITDNSENVVLRQITGNSGTGQGTTKLRYTLGGSQNNSYFRIHTLYAANYRAGDNSLNNTSTANTQGVNFLERYKDGYLHGNLYPGADDTYDLGSGTWQWKDAYFDGTVNADALDVDGNADIAGNLSLSGNISASGTLSVSGIDGGTF